jgi:hydrogenase maturation protein HypF
VPAPVELGYSVDGIFAAGAELKNCFALGRERQAILSQHIGDLKGAATYDFYRESVAKFEKLLRVKPSLAACDLHPDYLSTRYAQETGLPLVRVQHHHAHIAACMAEHGLDEPVMGVAFDGTGYGADGTIWGGEFLVCDLADYERVAHLKPLPMPGADKAVEEPWRMALAYLADASGDDSMRLSLPFLAAIPEDQLRITITALAKRINCPLTSGAGRLFDAVAAMTGLCMQATFEAEPAMRLEAAVDAAVTSSYPMGDGTVLDPSPLVRAIVDDLVAAMPVSAIAAKFHNAVVRSVCGVAGRIRRERGLSKVVLSGGIFQNRCILGRAEALLKAQRFEVFAPHTVPANDGGIALGQLVVAARRRALGCA